MEAVAAFGLAVNVLQVVDFASKVLTTGHQIYQAGATVHNAELEVVVNDFSILSKRLRSWVRPNTLVLGPLGEDGQVHEHEEPRYLCQS
jgi:hypothetical protein